MQGFYREAAEAGQGFGGAFLELPFEGGVEEGPEVREGLGGMCGAVGVEVVAFGGEEGVGEVREVRG